jgi:hypothetical protein
VFDVTFNEGLVAAPLSDGKGTELQVPLGGLVAELAPEEPLYAEDGVDGIFGSLVLGRLANVALHAGECEQGWHGALSLGIDDGLYNAVFPYTNAAVCHMWMSASAGERQQSSGEVHLLVVPKSMPIAGDSSPISR